MNTMHWMFAAILMLCGASALASCNSTAGNHANDAEQADTVIVQSDTYEAAIERFLIDSIGSHYGSGDVCIPCNIIVGIDSTDIDDIKVWGAYWVYRYNVMGDTLKCMSGGSHPGLMHVSKDDLGYEVTAFEAVGDGSQYMPSAKRIFGDKYNKFFTVTSCGNTGEQARMESIKDYVKRHGINVTCYQDYGWPAVKL